MTPLVVMTPEELSSLVKSAVAEALREFTPPTPAPVSQLDPKKFYTVKEFAALVGVDDKSIYAQVQEGKLPCFRAGPTKGFRIPETALDVYRTTQAVQS